MRLFSFAKDKSDLTIEVQVGDKHEQMPGESGTALKLDEIERPQQSEPAVQEGLIEVPLIKLAWGRSGDKGNKANVGIIAREAEYLPYIWNALSESAITERFAHFLESTAPGAVERYLMPGSNAMNILMHDVLGGGGVASIRSDAQGKGYAQILLACPVPVSPSIAEKVS